MNRSTFFIFSTIATFALTAMPTGAVAQQKSLKEQLVGTWMLVQSTGKRPDGSPSWGQNPAGAVVFDANGRYTSILVRSDIPKYASNNRLNGTPAEEKATVQGSIGTVGTYTVNEADRSYTIRVEGSTFPNWNGTAQKRTVVSISADELKVDNPSPSIGGPSTQLIYRRAK
jgi:lipocalin-like protein